MPRITRAFSCGPLTAATAPTAAQYQWESMISRPAKPAPTIATPTDAAISPAMGPTGCRGLDDASAVLRVKTPMRAVMASPNSTLGPPTSSTSPKEAVVAGIVAHAPTANTGNRGPGGCHRIV